MNVIVILLRFRTIPESGEPGLAMSGMLESLPLKDPYGLLSSSFHIVPGFVQLYTIRESEVRLPVSSTTRSGCL